MSRYHGSFGIEKGHNDAARLDETKGQPENAFLLRKRGAYMLLLIDKNAGTEAAVRAARPWRVHRSEEQSLDGRWSGGYYGFFWASFTFSCATSYLTSAI